MTEKNQETDAMTPQHETVTPSKAHCISYLEAVDVRGGQVWEEYRAAILAHLRSTPPDQPETQPETGLSDEERKALKYAIALVNQAGRSQAKHEHIVACYGYEQALRNLAARGK